MAEERDSKCYTTAVKLLITSTDCDPKAELPFSDDTLVRWNPLYDAINYKYSLVIHDLPPPSNFTRVAFLSLLPSKGRVAVLYLSHHSRDFEKANYRISYDESLMNGLPTHCKLKGLPRFHLFTSLPEDLQLHVVRLLDGVGFARFRCVSRQYFSRLKWDHTFNILRYSHPDIKVKDPKKRDYFFNNACLLRFASAVLIGVVVYGFFNKVPSGVYDDEEYE